MGKSTLVNALTGTKVAIVSDKPHTTRHRIRGVHTTDDAQLVLVDLPGWQKPVDTMTERMQVTVDETMKDADVDAVLLVVNARERIGAGDRHVARSVFALGVPIVIVVNKIEAEARSCRPADGGRFRARAVPRAASCERPLERRDRRAAQRPDLAAAGEGPMYYPTGTDTDMPLEARIAELVREQALHRVKEELPHAITAEVVEMTRSSCTCASTRRRRARSRS